MQLGTLLTLGVVAFGSFVAAAPQGIADGQGAAANSTKLLTCVKAALTGSNKDQRVITPSSAEYDSARSGVILVDQKPALVVYANSPNELSPLVKCGASNGYKVTPRVGAHHFENWSALTGTLVIDISNINYIMPSKDYKTVTIGGGAKLGTIYSILSQYGVTMIGGICPTVGLGGYVAVGGYNMQMRSYGMAVDHIASIKIVLANGTLATVSPTSNTDLWFAMRGGGTYGLTAEVTMNTAVIPRSAMFRMDFGNSTRQEVTEKYLAWAARQDPLFNSQLNLYGNRTNILGWYIGKTEADMMKIVKTSGLLDVKNGTVKISGNCSTANSRNFWLYTQEVCTDDATADKLFASWFNISPDSLTPVPNVAPVTALNRTVAIPSKPRAQLWGRAMEEVRTYFETKDKPLDKTAIKWLVDESAKLPVELDFWVEITTFNISTSTTSSFPWLKQARTLFRLQIFEVADAKVQAIGEKFSKDAEAYLRPKFGSASYSGYIDADISSNPYEAYYGSNVCKLVAARKRYDPGNIFTNPFAIMSTPPKGYTC